MHSYQHTTRSIQRSVLVVAGCTGSCLADIDFDRFVEIAADGEVTRIAVGDLDADCDIDVVALIPGDLGGNGSIQAFVNEGVAGNGDWLGLTPTTASMLPPGEPTALAVGLFDNDQFLAAVTVADAPQGHVVQTRRWNPDLETFENHQSIGLVDRPSAVKLAHFDDDGILDLAVALENNNEVVVIFGSGGGFFDPGDTQEAGTGGFQPIGIEPECLIEDPARVGQDLAGINNREQLGPGVPGQIFVLSNGPLGFDDPLLFEIGVDPTDISIGDLNIDGFLDIVATNGGADTASLLLNDAGADFVQDFVVVGGSPVSIVAVDLDVDEDADLAVIADDLGGDPTVRVLENLLDGDLFFGAPVEFSVGATPNDILSADINLDGIQDLITGNLDDATVAAGSISVLLNAAVSTITFDGVPDGLYDFYSEDGFILTPLKPATQVQITTALGNPGLTLIPGNPSREAVHIAREASAPFSLESLDIPIRSIGTFDEWTVQSSAGGSEVLKGTGTFLFAGPDWSNLTFVDIFWSNEEGGNIVVDNIRSILAGFDTCPWDLDGDGVVGTIDLLLLLGAWNTNPGGPPDFNGDGIVDASDLIELLGNWGPCE